MSAPREGRLEFVDDARGLAVVLMIFWHTAHGWIAPAVHAESPRTWDTMRVFGGTAAPLFVMLAGVSAAMKLSGDAARGKSLGDSCRELFARGLHVLAMGYALRIYTYAVDDRALLRPGAWPAVIPLVLGLFMVLEGLERLGPRQKAGAGFFGVGAALYAFGVLRALELEPSRAAYFFKVDVLQAIGASLAIIALLTRAVRIGFSATASVVFGLLVASLTDPVSAALTDSTLAPALRGYLTSTPGPRTPNLGGFPLLPWVGYGFFGVGIGHAYVRLSRHRSPELAVVGVGALLAGLGAIANGPPFHRHLLPWAQAHLPALAPFLYKPLFLVNKVGFGLGLLVLYRLFVEATGRSPFRTMGKTSMLIYWVHMEFAYGLLAKPLKHRLGLLEWLVGFVLLTGAMMAVAHVRQFGLPRRSPPAA